MVGAIIMLLIGTALFGIGIYASVNKNKEKQAKRSELLEKGSKYNAICSIEIKHICGLSLTENSSCVVHLCENEIVIEGIGNVFKLQSNRIIDMNIKTSKEVQNSISGAVGGAILLGPIGAFLGGTSTEFHRFFIIIYKNKENENKCISFDMKEDINAYKQIYNYIEKFNASITNKNEVDL